MQADNSSKNNIFNEISPVNQCETIEVTSAGNQSETYTHRSGRYIDLQTRKDIRSKKILREKMEQLHHTQLAILPAKHAPNSLVHVVKNTDTEIEFDLFSAIMGHNFDPERIESINVTKNKNNSMKFHIVLKQTKL